MRTSNALPVSQLAITQTAVATLWWDRGHLVGWQPQGPYTGASAGIPQAARLSMVRCAVCCYVTLFSDAAVHTLQASWWRRRWRTTSCILTRCQSQTGALRWPWFARCWYRHNVAGSCKPCQHKQKLGSCCGYIVHEGLHGMKCQDDSYTLVISHIM